MRMYRMTQGLACGITLLCVGASFIAGIGTECSAGTPRVSNETPTNASQYVSVYLPEISFTVRDSENSSIHYTVATIPDFIGGPHNGTVASGTTIHILRRNEALANDAKYIWSVNATDGTAWVHQTYSFTTVSDIFQGYTLFTPMDAHNDLTFLIDNNGNVVHTWPTSNPPNNGVYMVENGSILRPYVVYQGNPPRYTTKIQKIAWNGTVTWDFQYSSENYWQTHDLAPLPNGDVLILALERKTAAEAISAGRNPALLWENELLTTYLVEVKPTGLTSGTIVWEWHLWDHLIQDLNSKIANYGVVSDHPELLDINFMIDGNKDWIHPNTICYNPALDQVIINSRHLGEFWVIDHSTTTQQAANHSGGIHGKGGDFLYRWGNPQSYRAGNASDQRLFGPHDPQWIAPGCPGEGHILIFNNGWRRPGKPYSSIYEIEPPIDANGNYLLIPGTAYGPENLTWQYTAEDPSSFYAEFISGCQRLPNGDTLICNGPSGFFFEVTMDGKTVWSYLNPYFPPNCRVFRIRRYYSPFCPPVAPIITGPTTGRVGIQYNYTFVTTDPDGDNVYYQIDWGDNTPMTLVGPYTSGEEITLNHTWEAENHYLIECEAKDPYNSTSTSAATMHIGTPYQPSNPFPADGATGVDIHTNLSWIGGDPDPEDTVTYDVYFGTSTTPPKIASNQSSETYIPGVLRNNSLYYWTIIAWDNHKIATAGPLWSFSTVPDTTPPETTHAFNGTLGENTWYISPTTVTLTATDNQTGVNITLYKLDCGTWTTYTTPFTISDDGYHTIAYYSIDNEGNTEVPHTIPLNIDQEPPITTHSFSGLLGDSGWYVTAGACLLTAKDNTSGVNHTYYQIDDASWIEYTAPVVLAIDGVHSLNYYSIDLAGNQEPVKGPFSFYIDQTPPTITLTKQKIGLTQVKFTAQVSDATSGIDRVGFSLDGQLQYTDTEAPYEWTWTGTGNHTMNATVYDVAGNSKSQSMSTPVDLQSVHTQQLNQVVQQDSQMMFRIFMR